MTLVVSNINLTSDGTSQFFVNAVSNSFVFKVGGSSHSMNSSGISVGNETVNSSGLFKSGVQIQPLPGSYDIGEYIIVDSTTAQPANSIAINTSYVRSSYPSLVPLLSAPYIDQTLTQRPLSNSNVLYTRDVAFGNGVFVVPTDDGGGGAPGFNVTVTGATWLNRSAANSNIMNSIVWGNAATYGLFAAFGLNGAVQTSANGSVWTNRNNNVNVNHNYYISGFGGNTLIAFDSTSSQYITSTSGTTWTTRSLPTGASVDEIAFGNSRFVGVGLYFDSATNNYTPSSYVSTDNAVTFTRYTIPYDLGGVAYGNNKFLAISFAGRGVYSTTDGISWSQVGSLPEDTQSPPFYIRYLNNIFVVYGGGYHRFYCSYDGTAWTVVDVPGSLDPSGVAYGNSVYMFVGPTSSSGAVYTSPLTSYNSNSQFRIAPLNNLLSGRTAYVRYQ